MEIVELIAEGEKVVGDFRCSGTISESGLGCPRRPPVRGGTEVYIFEIRDGRLASALGVEETRLAESAWHLPALA